MRLAGSAFIGLAVAVALFLLMSQLIAGNNEVARRDNVALNLDFIRLNLDEIENIRRRTAPPTPEVVEPPEAPPVIVDVRPDTDMESFAEIDASAFSPESMNLGSGFGVGRFSGGIALGDLSQDGDLYPVLQVTPIYPAAARLAKQFGWVDLEYTVLIDGSVVDPVVLDSKVEQQFVSSVVRMRIDQEIFNQAAIDAILRTKFKPRVIDGEPVPVRVTQRFTFNVVD